MDFVLHLQDHLRTMKDFMPDITHFSEDFPAHDHRGERTVEWDNMRLKEIQDLCEQVQLAIATLEQKAQETHDLVCVPLFLGKLESNCEQDQKSG